MNGLNFTPEEDEEFKKMTRIEPKNAGEKMSILADKFANNIWMFIALLLFSVISYTFLQPILNQMLFLSNTYQLIALPLLGTATALSTAIILKFLFRIYLNQKKRDEERLKELLEIKDMATELHSMYREDKEWRESLTSFIKDYVPEEDLKKRAEIRKRIDEYVSSVSPKK